MHHVALLEISQCVSTVLFTCIIFLPNTRHHLTFGLGSQTRCHLMFGVMTHPQLLKGLKCEPKQKSSGKGGVGARSLTHNPLRGRGVGWSSGMGLGRVDKLQSLTRACTQPTQSGQCKVRPHLVLRRATGNTDTQDSPRPGLGGSHHLPPYSILCDSPRSPHPNGYFPGTPARESRNRAKWDSRDFGAP